MEKKPGCKICSYLFEQLLRSKARDSLAHVNKTAKPKIDHRPRHPNYDADETTPLILFLKICGKGSK